MNWIEKKGHYIDRATLEMEHQPVLQWLIKALTVADKNSVVLEYAQKLLGLNEFTLTMSFMKIFLPLQEFCQCELIKIGSSLKEMYVEKRYFERLGSSLVPPPMHCEILRMGGGDDDLRQDHPAVGFSHESLQPYATFREESVYIHWMRIVATCCNNSFQQRLAILSEKCSSACEHKRADVKSYATMRSRTLDKYHYRYLVKPRPSHSLDVLRATMVFPSVEAMKRGIQSVVSEFSSGGVSEGDHMPGGVGRVDNGFLVSQIEAAKMHHRRSYVVNMIVDFGYTFGQLVERLEAKILMNHYCEGPPTEVEQGQVRVSSGGGKEPWCRWREEAKQAVEIMRGEDMRAIRVRLVCEIRFMLREYDDVEEEMRLLDLVHNAESPLDLHSKFVKKDLNRSPAGATFKSENMRRVRETENALLEAAKMAACMDGSSKGEKAEEELRLRSVILLEAIRHDGSAAAVRCVLEVEEDDDEEENQELATKEQKDLPLQQQQQQRKIRVPKRGTHELVDEHFVPTPKVHVNQRDLTSKDHSLMMTALLYACQNGYHDVVKILLNEREIKINQTDAAGRSALYYACRENHPIVVQMLIEVGVNVQQSKNTGETPLYAACEHGHVDIVKLLLRVKGIKINQPKENGSSPLFVSSERGHLDVVRLLLRAKGIEINQAKDNGATPLFVACKMRNLEEAQLLLSKKNINPNSALNDGVSPLFQACADGNSSVVNLLVQARGIDINQCTRKNQTPINIACKHGHKDIVRVLLRLRNLDVRKKDAWDQTPLKSAQKEGHEKIAIKINEYMKFGPKKLR